MILNVLVRLNFLFIRKRYHPTDGRLIQFADDFEICDCLQPNCRGCHYPCKACGDLRCGKECRYDYFSFGVG
jgi:hypothetical protein